MTQARVLSFIDDLEYRDYNAGEVVDFPDVLLGWLKSRKLVDDTPSVVAAAIAGGATQRTHTAGSPPGSGAVPGGSGSVAVQITGTAGVGNVLTATPATGWSASSWQWYRDGSAISGATSQTYTQQSADAGKTLTVSGSGWSYTAQGVSVPSAGATAPVITVAPSIASAIAGSPLVFTGATVTGSPAPTVVYDVMQGTTVLASNVTSGSYTPSNAGISITIRATASNSAGTVSASSAAVTVSSSATLLTSGARLAVEGDSLAAGDKTGAHNFTYYALMKTRGRYYYPRSGNCAIGGTQVVGGAQPMSGTTRLNAVAAQAPAVVCFIGGHNDIEAGSSASATLAGIQACLDSYFANGAQYVVIGTVPPVNTILQPAWDSTKEATRVALNNSIKALASAKIKVVDIDAVGLDLTAAATTYQTGDGTHYNMLGAKLIGDAFAVPMNAIMDTSEIIGLYTDASNLLASSNPAMTGTTGGKVSGTGPVPTGNVPDNWRVISNAPGVSTACDVVTLNGSSALQITTSGTATGTNAEIRIQTLTNTTIVGNPGDAFEGWIECRIGAGQQNLRAVGLAMVVTGESGNVAETVSGGNTYLMPTTQEDGVLRTRVVITLTGSRTSLTFRPYLIFRDAAASAAVVTFAKPYLRKVTANPV